MRIHHRADRPQRQPGGPVEVSVRSRAGGLKGWCEGFLPIWPGVDGVVREDKGGVYLQSGAKWGNMSARRGSVGSRGGGDAGMFVGTFEHSLDDKGRVVLPATFRAQLAEKGFLSQLDRCLGLWTEEGFTDMAGRLQDKVRSGETSQESLRAFAANAHEVRPDSQGRITIPQRLREFASLDREAVVIGAFGRIEIWNADRWNDQTTLADDSLTQAVTSLGL